jgi:hypothetical protein
MKKNVAVRIWATMFLAVLPIQASAFLSSGGQECAWPLPNNLNDCAKPVQKAIYAAKKKWRFQFQCKRDKVVCVGVEQEDKVVTKWTKFVSENLDLFGIRREAQVITEVKPEGLPYIVPLELAQYWNGIPIKNVAATVPESKSGNKIAVFVNLVDTSAWKLPAKPRIPKAVAEQAARNYWKVSSAIKETELVIRIGAPDGCGSWESPVLAWEVEGQPDVNARLPGCTINAETGQPCGECAVYGTGGNGQ